jgi:hypothetical protein
LDRALGLRPEGASQQGENKQMPFHRIGSVDGLVKAMRIIRGRRIRERERRRVGIDRKPTREVRGCLNCVAIRWHAGQ